MSTRLKKVAAKASRVPLCQMKETICERVNHEAM